MLSWEDKSIEDLMRDMKTAVAELHAIPLGRIPPNSYCVMPGGGMSVGYDISRFVHSMDAASYRFLRQPRPQLTQQLELNLPE